VTDVVDPAVPPTAPLPDEPSRTPRGQCSSEITRAAWRVGGLVFAALLLHGMGEGPILWIALGVVCVVALAMGYGCQMLRRRRRAAAARPRPSEPWLADHDWNPTGTSRSTLHRVLLAAERRLLFPGGWWIVAWIGLALLATMARTGVRWPAMTIVLALATWLAWQIWRLHGVGTALVGYARFPFHPGETVTLRFGMAEGGATFHRAKFFLRRIGESRPSRGRSWATTKFELSESRPPGALPGPNQFVELTFDVPATAIGTCLSTPDPRYWVLDVVAATSAGPYCASFLVPIYDRPPTPPAA
jgi:hypothetical protein